MQLKVAYNLGQDPDPSTAQWSMVRSNDVTSHIASQVAAGASQTSICIRNTTGRTVRLSSREGTWAPWLRLK